MKVIIKRYHKKQIEYLYLYFIGSKYDANFGFWSIFYNVTQ